VVYFYFSLLKYPLREVYLSCMNNYPVSINKMEKNTLTSASTFQVNLFVLFIGTESGTFTQITKRMNITNSKKI